MKKQRGLNSLVDPPVPRRSAQTRHRDLRDQTVFSGSDFLTTVAFDPTHSVGKVLASLRVSPSLWSGTRLEIESRNWEKYLIEQMEFKFVSTQPLTTGGQIVTFIDRDPKDTLNDSGQNLLIAAAASGNMRANATQHFSVRLPADKYQPDLYIHPASQNDADVRLSVAGILYVIYAGGYNLAVNNNVVWNVYVHYRVRFINKQLSPQVASTGGSRTQIVSSAPTIGNLLNQATKVVEQFPVDVSGDGKFSIPSSITDVNNVLLTTEIGEENSFSTRVSELFNLSLDFGQIEEGNTVPAWVERGTSGLFTNSWILSAVQGAGITGALYTTVKNMAPKDANFLFSLIPKTVTSFKKIAAPSHCAVVGKIRGLRENPMYEGDSLSSNAIIEWDGAGNLRYWESIANDWSVSTTEKNSLGMNYNRRISDHIVTNDFHIPGPGMIVLGGSCSYKTSVIPLNTIKFVLENFVDMSDPSWPFGPDPDVGITEVLSTPAIYTGTTVKAVPFMFTWYVASAKHLQLGMENYDGENQQLYHMSVVCTFIPMDTIPVSLKTPSVQSGGEEDLYQAVVRQYLREHPQCDSRFEGTGEERRVTAVRCPRTNRYVGVREFVDNLMS